MIPVRPSKFVPVVKGADCSSCGDETNLGFSFSYAFQPIIDLRAKQIFAHEALVRGPANESAYSVLSQVNELNRYQFDQACRTKALKTAAALGMQTRLSINFMPNAIYKPDVCIRSTLEAAALHAFPPDRIIFETVEGERVDDGKWLAEIFREYKRIGFLTAIDDFGAGYAGLNLLADFAPDIVKLDMGLIRGIDAKGARQAIVRNMARMCEELHISLIAEGVETLEECKCLRDLGINLIQGYLVSKPVFQSCATLETLVWPL
jgi:EAL domain-containing protein (putative c-di-GMP-specific phosphodiesterase class I)